jgi:carbon-monoxide dehydrogenase medium subunit
MYLPDFNYYQPGTIPEACEILVRYGSKAKVLAGGTDVLPKMKQELLAPEALVSLRGINGMTDIEYLPGRGVVIGARATPNDIVNSAVLNDKFMSVSEAAHSMANNQIRNMGSVGGNIVNAVPSADLPPHFDRSGCDGSSGWYGRQPHNAAGRFYHRSGSHDDCFGRDSGGNCHS